MITALFYLYYEQHYATRQLGAFVMLVISAAVGFLLWYTVARDAAEIQPLVPALQSWWMKIHVPANFIGYGTFSLAAMVGVRLPAEVARHPGRPPAGAGSAGRRDVQVDRGRLRLLHDRHHAGRAVGGRSLGRLLVLGPEGDLGADRLAELRGLAAHAPDEGPARHAWRPGGRWSACVVTTFAFLGVNMFLSGLHSYGKL